MADDINFHLIGKPAAGRGEGWRGREEGGVLFGKFMQYILFIFNLVEVVHYYLTCRRHVLDL